MGSRLALVVSMVTLAGFAAADQQALVELEVADRAASVIPLYGVVRHLCEPCGDSAWREESVRSVGVESAEWGGLYEVVVNGNGVDLAYVYVETDGGWRNLATMLDLEVTGVSTTLPRQGGAPEPDGTEAADPCESPRTTSHARECAQAELEAADAELNRVYAELMQLLEEPRRSRLQEAQRAWIPYRDACAEFEAALFEGGSMAPVLRISEQAHRTRQRVEELRHVLEVGE